MLRKPYTIEKFLGLAKSVLAKTTPVNVGIALPEWERQPQAVGLPQR